MIVTAILAGMACGYCVRFAGLGTVGLLFIFTMFGDFALASISRSRAFVTANVFNIGEFLVLIDRLARLWVNDSFAVVMLMVASITIASLATVTANAIHGYSNGKRGHL